jgi:DNA-binding transcriptional ArsR family regulator
MASLDHDHPVDPARVETARQGLIDTQDAARLARLLGLIQDPARSRVLFALSAVDELCVGDLALALDVSEDAVSYALKLLRTAGLVQFRKHGRIVYYRLSDAFPHRLLEHCLRQLLTIGEEAGGRL